MARTIDSTFTCSLCDSGTITTYTRADVKILSTSPIYLPQTTTTVYTRRDATRPPLNPIPAPQKPSKRQHTSKTRVPRCQHIDGSVPKKHIRDLTHTHQTPTVTKKSRIQKATKPSAAEKKTTTAHQPGGKRGGENLLGGYDESTRAGSQRSWWWW